MNNKLIATFLLLWMCRSIVGMSPELSSEWAKEKEEIFAMIIALNPKGIAIKTASMLGISVQESDITKIHFEPINGSLFSLTAICKNGDKIVTELDDPYIWRHADLTKYRPEVRKKI